MRRLTIKVDTGQGIHVKSRAEKLGGKNLTITQADTGELVTVHISNNQVSNFIESLDDFKEAEINLIPRGVITMYPPSDEVADQVTDVTFRSPLEIYLGGLQSVGSMKGLLSYALAGGMIVWIGLYTNTAFLLVAAMLVSPFAGPAMNAAVGAASGEKSLLLDSLKRYFIAIAVAAVVAFILSFLVKQQYATPLMISVSHISQVSVLLPLLAGFAGAINLVQSERNSLVSGAAVGMLVAASLAPPTALIGMALNFGNWQLIRSGVFLLILQLAGIQLAAALVFRYAGNVTVNVARFAKGEEYLFKLSVGLSVLIGGALLYWQFSSQPGLQKSSLSTEITEIMKISLDKVQYIKTIDADTRFTRGTLPDKNPVICELYLLNQSDSLTDEQVKKQVIDLLRKSIKAKHFNADPMFDITMLKTD